MEQAADLIVRIDAPDSDEDELGDLSRALLSEIRDGAEVETAALVTSPGGPAGAKSGGILELGTVGSASCPWLCPPWSGC